MREQVGEVLDAGARVIHIDVMDGHFVPVITFGPKMVADITEADPRPRRLRGRAPDDRAAGAPHRPVRGRRGRQHHGARRDLPAPAPHASRHPRPRLPGRCDAEPGHPGGGARGGGAVRGRAALHERQPRIRRAGLHPRDARSPAAHARAGRTACASPCRWRSTAASDRPPSPTCTVPAPTSWLPGRPSSRRRSPGDAYRELVTLAAGHSRVMVDHGAGGSPVPGAVPRAGRAGRPHGGAEPDGRMRARARRGRHRRGLARAPGIAARRGDRPGGGGRCLGCHRLRQPRAVRAPRPHAALLRRPDRRRGRPRGDRGDRPGSPHQRTGHRAVARRGRRGRAGRRATSSAGPATRTPGSARWCGWGARTSPTRPPSASTAAWPPPAASRAGSPRRRAGRWCTSGGRGRAPSRVGIGTALADDPMLTARDCVPPAERQPLRVVFDRAARLPVGSALVRSAGEGPVAVVCRPGAPGIAALAAAGVEAIEASDAGQALAELGRRGVATLLLEGGAHPRRGAAAATAWSTGWRCSSRRCVLGAGPNALEGWPAMRLGEGELRAEQPPGRPGYAAGGRRARGLRRGGDVHRDRDRAGRGGASRRPGCGCARPASPPTPRSATRWPWTAAA